jgi:hypothetical protein
MTARSKTQRSLAPVLFGLAALAFLLPFATVSCKDAETTFTGIQLVTKSVPPGGAIDSGRPIGEEVEDAAFYTAVAAFAAAVFGFFLTALGVQKGPGWLAAAGLASMVWLMKIAISTLAETVFHAGYWLVLLLFLCAGGLHAWRAIKRRRLSNVTGGGQLLQEEAF